MYALARTGSRLVYGTGVLNQVTARHSTSVSTSRKSTE